MSGVRYVEYDIGTYSAVWQGAVLVLKPVVTTNVKKLLPITPPKS